MRAIAGILGFCMAALSGYGQTIVFTGQLLNNNTVVKNYTVIINGKPATTNDSGVFTTAISSSATQLDIKASDKSYIIAYPTNGRVLVPKDPSLLTQIVLEPFQSNGQLKNYLASVSGLKEAAKKGQSATKALQAKIDSLAASLIKIGYTNDDLRAERERQDGIDLFYPEISSALQDYIYQGQMLMSAFKTISTDAFKNPSALTQYGQTQNSFNQAYEKLYSNYPTYSKKMDDYWGDPALTAEFGGIVDTLLYGIGKNKIQPLNDVKNQVNQYFQSKLSNKDKNNLKTKIQAQITAQIPGITNQLNVTDQHIKQFLDRLKN
ncbi:hypothetical protein FO440_04200 [Mucilaginibacter corticis]|uniref:Uncharacterized protein n=1 Tax=Mucilaginibacter corticis TaxID=2597670 RepID=A0A556MUA1_9SPHI|nr:hypothetical protein [Mucilaginibacter corticis]TSJ43402.1 hypothetical protein FO440_04200 [Mucilaginibacter corticis]